MAAASMKRAGKVRDMEARAMVTVWSSRGWRMTSSTLRGKFGQLVEEEQAVVRQRDFAGARHDAAADEPGVGDGVMRRAEALRKAGATE